MIVIVLDASSVALSLRTTIMALETNTNVGSTVKRGKASGSEGPPPVAAQEELPELNHNDMAELQSHILSSDSVKSLLVLTELKKMPPKRKRASGVDAEGEEA